MLEDDIFQRYSPNFSKLLKFGFKKNKGIYHYEQFFKNNEFKAIIKISNSKISGTIYDVENDDEFLPIKASDKYGSFVSEVKEEYKNILINIRENCFEENYFISSQANRIAKLIIEKYNDTPEFMWEKFPTYGVFKNKNTNKWYGIIMNISKKKLGEDSDAPVEIINIKLDKEKIQTLINKKGYYPAWHMNKTSWITLSLDEKISDDEILNHIEESYSYTIKK